MELIDKVFGSWRSYLLFLWEETTKKGSQATGLSVARIRHVKRYQLTDCWTGIWLTAKIPDQHSPIFQTQFPQSQTSRNPEAMKHPLSNVSPKIFIVNILDLRE